MSIRLKAIGTVSNHGSCVECNAPGVDPETGKYKDDAFPIVVLQIGMMCPQLCRGCLRELEGQAGRALSIMAGKAIATAQIGKDKR